MSIQKNILPDNPQIEVIKSGKTGLFTNYIYKAIPLAFDESMSYYETLLGLLHYLKNVILPTVNNNADAVAELQSLYEELRSYVDNYFKGLDVQEEINNKLDEMVEDGTLDQIIEQYLNSSAIWGFDTVEDMKNASNLINGSFAQTLGYYNRNDGGNALYKIRDLTNADVVDNMTIIPIGSSTLIAELIIKNQITPETLGAKGDALNDDSDYIEKCFNIAKEKQVDIVLSKNYLINKVITLDGSSNRINIIQSTGYLKIDGQITLTDLQYSKLEFRLYQGGSGDVNTYGIIFKLLYKCDLNLYANNVNKTAFFINTQQTPYTASKWNTVKLKGVYNVRTLLHGSTSTSQGTTFGEYIDIEDDRFEYPIRFQYATDINILHYENLVNDTTFTKNSLEFYHAGARCSLMCLGGRCKNLVYIEDGYMITDYLLIINEDDEITEQENLRVTGVYIKGDSSFKADYISNYKCLYTVDAHEMQNQNKCVIGHTYINANAVPRGRGSLLPNVAGQQLITSYNSALRAKDVSILSNYGSNLTAYKIQDEIHVNGYITIENNIGSNTVLATIGGVDEQAYKVAYCNLRQGNSMVKIGRIRQNENTLQTISGINLSDGANIYVDLIYRSKHV